MKKKAIGFFEAAIKSWPELDLIRSSRRFGRN